MVIDLDFVTIHKQNIHRNFSVPLEVKVTFYSNYLEKTPSSGILKLTNFESKMEWNEDQLPLVKLGIEDLGQVETVVVMMVVTVKKTHRDKLVGQAHLTLNTYGVIGAIS